MSNPVFMFLLTLVLIFCLQHYQGAEAGRGITKKLESDGQHRVRNSDDGILRKTYSKVESAIKEGRDRVRDLTSPSRSRTGGLGKLGLDTDSDNGNGNGNSNSKENDDLSLSHDEDERKPRIASKWIYIFGGLVLVVIIVVCIVPCILCMSCCSNKRSRSVQQRLENRFYIQQHK